MTSSRMPFALGLVRELAGGGRVRGVIGRQVLQGGGQPRMSPAFSIPPLQRVQRGRRGIMQQQRCKAVVTSPLVHLDVLTGRGPGRGRVFRAHGCARVLRVSAGLARSRGAAHPQAARAIARRECRTKE